MSSILRRAEHYLEAESLLARAETTDELLTALVHAVLSCADHAVESGAHVKEERRRRLAEEGEE